MVRAVGTGLRAIVLCLGAVLLAMPGRAQQPVPRAPMQTSFLFVNQERLLTGSRSGQLLLAEEEEKSQALREEARSIDAAFEAEERALAARRAELGPEEFRPIADAFDARVVEARQQQDERSAALAQELDHGRRQFFARVAPLLVAAMERHGAAAIFDENSVLLSDQSINITDEIILAIDTVLAPDDADALPSAGTESEPNTPTEGGSQQ